MLYIYESNVPIVTEIFKNFSLIISGVLFLSLYIIFIYYMYIKGGNNKNIENYKKNKDIV